MAKKNKQVEAEQNLEARLEQDIQYHQDLETEHLKNARKYVEQAKALMEAGRDAKSQQERDIEEILALHRERQQARASTESLLVKPAYEKHEFDVRAEADRTITRDPVYWNMVQEMVNRMAVERGLVELTSQPAFRRIVNTPIAEHGFIDSMSIKRDTGLYAADDADRLERLLNVKTGPDRFMLELKRGMSALQYAASQMQAFDVDLLETMTRLSEYLMDMESAVDGLQALCDEIRDDHAAESAPEEGEHYANATKAAGEELFTQLKALGAYKDGMLPYVLDRVTKNGMLIFRRLEEDDLL